MKVEDVISDMHGVDATEALGVVVQEIERLAIKKGVLSGALLTFDRNPREADNLGQIIQLTEQLVVVEEKLSDCLVAFQVIKDRLKGDSK